MTTAYESVRHTRSAGMARSDRALTPGYATDYSSWLQLSAPWRALDKARFFLLLADGEDVRMSGSSWNFGGGPVNVAVRR